MFRKIEETFQLIEQIANYAAKKYSFIENFLHTFIYHRLLSQKDAFREEDFFPAVTK
jgi:hypothetical protein